MWQFLKNLPFIRLFRKQDIDTEELKEERWVADFSKPHKARFIQETGSTYESHIGKQGLSLTLQKGFQLAWVEDPLYRYADLIIEGTIHLEAQGSYGAAGFQIRRTDDSSYYSFLLSSKGYFRFDVLFNGTTLPLIGWTEAPLFNTGEHAGNSVRIIALGDKFTIIINDRWAGEIVDETIPAGKLAFSVVSYEEKSSVSITGRLQTLVVDSRLIEVEAVHLRWNRFIKIDEAARFRLAETFLAMNQPLSALVQIKRIWKTAGSPRSQGELLFAARCAMQLSLYEEAEDYLDHCLEADVDSEESRIALAEKAKLLYLQSRYADLEEHAKGALDLFPQDPILHTLLGHAYMNLGRPDLAAQAYDNALTYTVIGRGEVGQGSGLERSSGTVGAERREDLERGTLARDRDAALIAQNAGSAYEKLGDTSTALERYLEAGRLFLNTESYNDLALVIPRLLELGKTDPRAHSLAGKYYFVIEDFHRAEKELDLADLAPANPSPTADNTAPDPAVPYLKALLLIKKDKRKTALAFLQRAVEQAPNSALFHFRLAENLFLLHQNPKEKELWDHINRVFALQPDDGWTLNLAAQITLKEGNLEAAAAYLEKAAALLPQEAAVRMNQAELAFIQGDIDKALSLLKAGDLEDPEGLLAHQAGTILYRADRLEEARVYFDEALEKCPDRLDYLVDQANCLINLGLYGEADTLLAKAYDREENESVLDLIGYIAYKKGEFARAEAAYRLALEQDPDNPNFLSALAWVYITIARWSSAEDCIQKLEQLISPESPEYGAVQELRERLLMGTTRLVSCASCSRSWRVQLNPPPAPPLRLVAEPPDELPAGTCIHCGKTYCIGCAKRSLDESGRFVCPTCGERLKLYDEGLKKLLADWAAGAQG